MAKKLLLLSVRGREHLWSFEVEADPKYIEEWRADGIEIYPICNIIPEWVANAGLVRPWCFFQDILGFKNPWSKT